MPRNGSIIVKNRNHFIQWFNFRSKTSLIKLNDNVKFIEKKKGLEI